MAKYIDGFILVVPKKKVAEYKKMARMGAKVWKKYGALDYKECMGEDLYPKIPGGMKHFVFPKLAKAKKNETVWFSYIVYKSKKHRDEVNAKVMKEMDKEMEKYKNKPMPFDMKRFAYGGFDVIVE
jgi:alkaline phosphatase